MKKLLISILIILLLVLCGFAVTKGYNIGDFTVLGVETIKEKKESTLLKQIGFACVCVTVLIVVMLIVKHWRNRQSSS